MVLRAALLLAPVLAVAQPVVPLDTFWVRHYEGDSATPQSKCLNMAADIIFDPARRIVYTAGQGEANYPGNNDMLVVPYRDDGTQLMARAIGGLSAEDADMGHAILLDQAGDVHVGGSTYNVQPRWWDATACRLRWRDTIVPPESLIVLVYKSTLNRDDYAYDIVLGTRNDLYLAGTSDTVIRGYNGHAFAVTRISRGNYIRSWTKFFVLDTLAFGSPRRGFGPAPGILGDGRVGPV